MKVSELLPLSLLCLLGCAKVEPISQEDFVASIHACSEVEEANACER
jgi:hypothetical protein